MPGPRNTKRKKKNQTKKAKRAEKTQKEVSAEKLVVIPPAETRPSSSLTYFPSSPSPPPDAHTQQTYKPIRSQPIRFTANTLTSRPLPSPPPELPHPARIEYEPQKDVSDTLLQRPSVEDLGNGPHVRDISAFLESRIAAPPSLDDPLCAEFAQREILEMLCTILPEEMAMIMWYNKSRIKSRICPACKRLYHLGDATKDPLVDDLDDDEDFFDSRDMESGQPRRRHSEQTISGICSPLCFILVAYRYPGAIRSTWGRMAEELSDEIWDELDGPGLGDKPDTMGLSMMLKMTRCHDLGLGQLFFPDQDMQGMDDEDDDPGEDDVDVEKNEDSGMTEQSTV